ncbi:hypothetical protein [Altererythrobacter lutimaris]|uniref:HEPN domain-containing protein n=1 Tax=Altererythrobacter lutimaris TaxID=2743979 RepID=A0A850HAX4_9SPHN|nr:hypothetical protein [Altererythrobacter lutimaris]NVE94889.1 hypothetical protein [Altererythrobacter lutimaris]
MTNEEFVSMADPHMWLLTADNLHEQAIKLWDRRGEGQLIRRFPDGRSDAWDIKERSTILLASFALENAIKAFLVFENPSWVSNGRLAKPLRSHRLTELRDRSHEVPFRTKYTNVLEFFEKGMGSWARYPTGLTAEESEDLRNLSPKIWQGYLRIMRAYGRKLEKLLQSGWYGPHGKYGAWDCSTMEFLRQPDA